MIRSTSVEVYHQIKEEGLLSKLQWEVYDAVYKHGPATQQEIWETSFRNTQARNIMPRFAELTNLGVLRSIGKRPCRVTGRTCMEWDVTDRMPEKKTVLRTNYKKLCDERAEEIRVLKEANTHLQRELLRTKGIYQLTLWEPTREEMIGDLRHLMDCPRDVGCVLCKKINLYIFA